MNHLFDNTEKVVKFHQTSSQELRIKQVLNPHTHSFIDVELAHALGILSADYYRNHAGEVITLHQAASEGFIEFTIINQIDSEEMEIEYRSTDLPTIANLLIRQVYDCLNRCMISFQQAIDRDYLDTEFFLYSCSNISLSIHEAFYRGLILGELRTNVRQTKQISFTHPASIDDKENFLSILTNVRNSLIEFTSAIHIIDQCQLTSEGYIQDRTTGQCYLLTQAIECGLVSFEDRVFDHQEKL